MANFQSGRGKYLKVMRAQRKRENWKKKIGEKSPHRTVNEEGHKWSERFSMGGKEVMEHSKRRGKG